MAGRINSDDIAALKERADIAVVVGEYTSLKRAGSRLKGLCPFHAEKTPSFTVDSGRGFFHCFGCGVGGDVYGFLEKIEALSFSEAVERLARIVGYELRYEEMTSGQRKALGKRTRLTQALTEAARWYAEQLFTDEAEPAREYLRGRGLGRPEAEHFRLGWAPDRWDGLSRRLSTAGFGDEEIVEAGLATRGRQGLIDRFRGRIIFPIFDPGGNDVLAFGGRVVPGVATKTWSGDGAPPKYINSSESPVYRKSSTLYALNWARSEITRRSSAVVVEGYMDVIGLHMAGVSNVVATCGTALTADHFRALERFTPRVVLALDADDAGFAAAERARSLADEVGVRDVGVLPLPAGKDPADLAAEGRDAVDRALEHTKTAVEFQLEHLLRTADASTPEAQSDAYRRTFPLLLALADRNVRYRYVRDLVAPVVRLSADRIEGELDAELRRTGGPATVEAARAPVRPGDVTAAEPRDPQMRLERQVLQLALQAPHRLPGEWKLVTADDFRAPLSRQLFAALCDAPPGDLAAVLAAMPDDETRSRVRGLALAETTFEPDAGHEARLVARLRAASVERDAEAVREEIALRGEQLSTAESRALLARLNEFERTARALREESGE